MSPNQLHPSVEINNRQQCRFFIVHFLQQAVVLWFCMPAWLMKSESEVYSIQDLKRDRQTGWEGVRNYQARNYMKEMKAGDTVLFYHSNSEPTGIAGLAKVTKTMVPDPSQFDPNSPFHDPKSDPKSNVRWHMVHIGFVKTFKRLIPLDELKKDNALLGMPLLQKGQRLSVQPVSEQHLNHILKLSAKD